MNYDWLLAFAVFAEHRNFTQAARQLHISQPALHAQIRKLGEAVGRPLYRREGRGLVLTPEGQRLAAFGREVAERGRAVLEELRGAPRSGPVVLAAGQGAFLYLLGPAIRRFPQERWPLRLLAMAGPEAIAALRDARAHLCVVAADRPPADLEATRLRDVGQHVVLPRDHRLARRRVLRAEDLDGEPLILAPEGSPHRAMVQQLLRGAGCEPVIAVEVTGWELALQFARYGVGLAVVNDFCPAPRGMSAVPLQGAPPITYYALARGVLASPGTAALLRLIVETVSGT